MSEMSHFENFERGIEILTFGALSVNMDAARGIYPFATHEMNDASMHLRIVPGSVIPPSRDLFKRVLISIHCQSIRKSAQRDGNGAEFTHVVKHAYLEFLRQVGDGGVDDGLAVAGCQERYDSEVPKSHTFTDAMR